MNVENPSHLLILLIASLAVVTSAGADPAWKPLPEKMMTPWGTEVPPENAWREYPRPQFERPDWQNFNGLSDYAVTAIDADKPAEREGEILLPFDIESIASAP